MQYRLYGRTGKQISVVAFGGMRFGQDEAEGVRAMVRAAQLGINYFDTAPGYCRDRSEAIFGLALKEIEQPVYVSTKSSIGDDPDADAVLRRIERSLQIMGLERLPFFHMWCLMDEEQFGKVMARGGPYEGALKARDQGLVEHLVFSTHANGAGIRKMCASGAFEGVTLGYNILNHKNRYDGLRAAAENGMGVVAMNPLAGGMLPAGAGRFDFLRRSPDDSVVLAGLRFVISHPEVTAALAGMGTLAEVEENARAGAEIEAPSQAAVDEIKAHYEALGEAFCTGCDYCQPCPQGIQIGDLLHCLNRHDLGQEKAAQAIYKWLRQQFKDRWEEPSSCSGCKECETRCTQRLPVSELLGRCVTLFEEPSRGSEEEPS